MTGSRRREDALKLRVDLDAKTVVSRGPDAGNGLILEDIERNFGEGAIRSQRFRTNRDDTSRTGRQPTVARHEAIKAWLCPLLDRQRLE